LTLLLAVGGLLEVALTDVSPVHPVPLASLSMVAAAAMLLRTARPLVCLLLTLALIVVAHLPGTGVTLTGTVVVAFLLALASVGRHAPNRRSVAAVVGATILFVVAAAFGGRPWDVVVVIMACGAAWGAGRLLRGEAANSARLGSLADEIAAQQELRTRDAVQGERIRVARELHDTVAHLVSVMTLHAGGVRRRLDDDPARQPERDALLEVERLGREAVGELHSILGVLRTDEPRTTESLGSDVAVASSPQPSLADLPQLVARVSAAGVPVELTVDGEGRGLSAGAELAAYRVAQEALTNVLKHGSRSGARVQVTYGREAVEVMVEDPGRPAATVHAAGSGLGLAGIRERVAFYGGRVEVGSTDAGFRVWASLPVEEVR
jgi:signal transduction histidine kinase